MTTTKQNKELDQFFTQDHVVVKCLDSLDMVLKDYVSLQTKDLTMVEPSAGDGAFYKPMLERYANVKGYDLEPRCVGVEQADFLTTDVQGDVYVGNPPFGKRSKLAIDFVNRAALNASVIAFIIPVQFRKWSVQSRIDPNLTLISDELLPEDAFRVDGKPYAVRCCFQIWVRKGLTDAQDIRLKAAPIITHPDFEMYQYNNTPAALKTFDNEFDFAVPRQGYQDYTRRETDKDKCEKTKQWIMFKAKDKKVLNKLRGLDFASLAKRNTTILGFGKADVISMYMGEV